MSHLDDQLVIAKMKARHKSTMTKLLMVSLLVVGSILITGCTKKTATPTSLVVPTGQSVLGVTEGTSTLETSQQPAALTQSATSSVIHTSTPTLTPSVTPTETCWMIITVDRAVLRAGPGRNYAIVGTATKGDKFRLLGRNHVGDWLYILFGQDRNAWIPTILGKFFCEINSLPEIPGPSTPAPAQTPMAPRPTTQPYGGGLLIPPDLAGAVPVTAPDSARVALSKLMLLILGSVIIVVNRRIFLPKSKAILKRSSQFILQLLTSIF